MKDLKNCILRFELNAIEKITMSLRRFSKWLRDESYFHLVAVLFEKKKEKTNERCKDENRELCIHSCRYAYKWEQSRAYVPEINGHGLHTT